MTSTDIHSARIITQGCTMAAEAGDAAEASYDPLGCIDCVGFGCGWRWLNNCGIRFSGCRNVGPDLEKIPIWRGKYTKVATKLS